MTKNMSKNLKPQKVSRNSFHKDCSLGSVGGSKIDANSSLLGHDELSSKNGKGSNKLRITSKLWAQDDGDVAKKSDTTWYMIR